MSYMGKGVTKAATLCLRHLSYEMATLSDDKVCIAQTVTQCISHLLIKMVVQYFKMAAIYNLCLYSLFLGLKYKYMYTDF